MVKLSRRLRRSYENKLNQDFHTPKNIKKCFHYARHQMTDNAPNNS